MSICAALLQLATIASAQQDPCSTCGPGPHWIAQCASGQHDMPYGAVVALDFDLDCVADVRLSLRGPAAVDHSDPLDDSVQFPGSSVIDGYLDVVDSEMVSMNLIGGGVTLIAGAGLGQGGVLAPSFGAIIEQQANSAFADSFFDILLEVDFGGGTYAYNHGALRLAATIDCLPPDADSTCPAGCLPLFDSPVFGTGTHIANLITADLSTYPECGDPGTGNCLEPHDTPFCSYSNCCESVCQLQPDCCYDAWDSGCVDLASQICQLTLSPTTLPDGSQGIPYNQTITASEGTAPYTYAVTSGSLPPDLSLSSGGNLTGTPTTPGTSNFTVTATDANSRTGSRAYSLDIILSPTADLAVSKTDGVCYVMPGSSTTYTITATNQGPDGVTGATVTDAFPATLTGVSWTCAETGGGTCTSGGAGNISDSVDLPTGGSVTYTATGTVDSGASGWLVNVVSVAVPGGSTDPDAGNNSATDVDALEAPIFCDGFESGDTSAW